MRSSIWKYLRIHNLVSTYAYIHTYILESVLVLREHKNGIYISKEFMYCVLLILEPMQIMLYLGTKRT